MPLHCNLYNRERRRFNYCSGFYKSTSSTQQPDIYSTCNDCTRSRWRVVRFQKTILFVLGQMHLLTTIVVSPSPAAPPPPAASPLWDVSPCIVSCVLWWAVYIWFRYMMWHIIVGLFTIMLFSYTDPVLLEPTVQEYGMRIENQRLWASWLASRKQWTRRKQWNIYVWMSAPWRAQPKRQVMNKQL